MQAMIHRPLENNVIINHLKMQGSTGRLDDVQSLDFDLELHETIIPNNTSKTSQNST